MRLPTPDLLADLDRIALVVVDVQRGFDEQGYLGTRNNSACESNIELLINAWTTRGRRIVLVRHDSTDPRSPLHPDQPGNGFKSILTVQPDLLLSKQVNSCFHGTPDLHAWLQQNELLGIAIAGITTNHCCETTARVGANLGHEVLFVLDATLTFDRQRPDGSVMSAEELTDATATNLHGEFATVVTTAHLTE